MPASNIRRGRSGVSALILIAALTGMAGGCASGGADEVSEATAAPSATPVPFRPTITPVPSPTELPPVTPPTLAPLPSSTPTATRDPNVASLIIQPNLGELNEEVRVTAFGFLPDSTVALHWTRPGSAPGGAPAKTVEADENGEFELTLTVPGNWPGGPPSDHEFLELRALGAENRQAWASYAFVVPFEPHVAPGSTYANATYGYALDLPPEWSAQDADPANVTFGPGGAANGSFVRVVESADMAAAVGTVMAEVEPGQSYEAVDSLLGAQAGQRVEAGSGSVYWFLGHAGRIYVLHFVADDPDVAEFTYTTFRFTG